ncbi:uncharacterized protein TNCV_1768611 [Trichonephila clavipes]|nr:uncharacterized protein TNCV_1768611 [Trichonephila clavipes]
MFSVAWTTETSAEIRKVPPNPENRTNVMQSWKELDKFLKDNTQLLIKFLMPTVLESSSQLNLSSQCMKDGFQLVSGLRSLKKWAVSYNLAALHFKYDQARRRFVEWAQNEIAVVPDFHKRILFSDEAHFWLNGYVNKQNCRIWSEANPQVNDEDHNVTVNGDRYRAMITNFFIPELNNHDVHELWFQQDGATCHTARATIDLLKDTFGDRLI